jgi:hypothetical protein
MNWGVPWKFADGAEDFVWKALKFHSMCICRRFKCRTEVSLYRPNESFMEGQFTFSA